MWMRNASDLGVGNWSFGPMVWVPSGEVWHPGRFETSSENNFNIEKLFEIHV